MNEEQFILLAVKLLSGNDLSGEKEQLQRLMADNKSYQLLFEKLEFYWRARSNSEINDEAALLKVWQQIENTPVALATAVAGANRLSIDSDPPPVKRIRWHQLLVAAALVPFICLGMWWLTLRSRKDELVEKYNQKGIRSTIILPDGSKIWLNADSRLKYPASFAANLREVYLDGEAFFEIAKNPQRPFVIHLPKATVKVLGTSFNIRSYSNENLLTASVATGKVAFVPDFKKAGAPSDSFYLSPNLKAVYHLNSSQVTIESTDPLADKSWINGVLIFNNESLGNIAIELERYFGKPVYFRRDEVSQYRYSATFRNNSAEEILELLNRVKSFRYAVTDKYIEIDK